MSSDQNVNDKSVRAPHDDEGLSHLPEADLRIVCWPYTSVRTKSDSEKARDRRHQQIIGTTVIAIFGVSLCFLYLPGLFIGLLLFWVQTEMDNFGTNKPTGIDPYLMCWLWLIWAVLYQILCGTNELDWFVIAIWAPGLLSMLLMSTHNSLYAISLKPKIVYFSRATGIKREYEPDGLYFVYIDSITLSPDKKYIIFNKNQRWRTEKSRWNESKTERIPIKAIPDRNSWDQIEQYIQKNAPHITIDPQISQQFQAHVRESATTFTQLWLQSMESPGKRLSMRSLQCGGTLKDQSITVVKQLSSGGQSCVYKAIFGGKEVVLKEYALPTSLDLAARKRSVTAFAEEAKLLGTMDHPGIVKIQDHFIEDHRGYMIFDLLEGVSLRSTVREKGPLGEEQVRNLLPQMIDILLYLGTRTPPVVHRDFTPDNLILSHDGTITLIDFTIATPVSETQQDPAGKQAYMSIEQFRGKPELASDLYSMGATLHFLLTGADPEPISVSHPKSIRANVSDELDQLVAELTALKATQRPSLETLSSTFPRNPIAVPVIEAVQ